MTKVSVYHIYMPSDRVSKYLKQESTELEGERNLRLYSCIFNIPLQLLINRPTFKKQNLNLSFSERNFKVQIASPGEFYQMFKEENSILVNGGGGHTFQIIYWTSLILDIKTKDISNEH